MLVLNSSTYSVSVSVPRRFIKKPQFNSKTHRTLRILHIFQIFQVFDIIYIFQMFDISKIFKFFTLSTYIFQYFSHFASFSLVFFDIFRLPSFQNFWHVRRFARLWHIFSAIYTFDILTFYAVSVQFIQSGQRSKQNFTANWGIYHPIIGNLVVLYT